MMKSLSLVTALLLPGVFTPACNSTSTTTSGPDLAGRTPLEHRPTATTCPLTRAPGPGGVTVGQCKMDSDCVDTTKGQNGRCVYTRIGGTCTYDTCFDDSPCLGKVCLCRPADETMASANANHCLTQGGCRTDSDCGTGGACSPSFSTCGAYNGVVSYYCHTPQDTCIDDKDCTGTDGGFGGVGYCMFSPEGGMWLCSYSQCAG